MERSEERTLLSATTQVINIASGNASSYPDNFTEMNGALYFTATNSTGIGVWKTDGTPAGTTLVKQFNSTATTTLLNLNGTLFILNTSLWKSDGTPGGTVLVKNFVSGTQGYLTNVNGTLYFAASDGTKGSELWKSDGTAAGTVMVKDIWSGIVSSSPALLTNVNGTLFFTADDGVNGRELWKSDGTAEGTLLLHDIRPGNTAAEISKPTSFNGSLYFVANDGVNWKAIWKSDGTPEGTVLFHQLPRPEATSNSHELANVQGRLFFTTEVGYGGRELWTSDGTAAGTVRLVEPGYRISIPVALNGAFFFFMNDGLWRTDGTREGTQRAVALDGIAWNLRSLVNFNGTMYFLAGWDSRLWKSDGTPAGTVQLMGGGSDVNSLVQPIASLGDRILFPARDTTYGVELWSIRAGVDVSGNGVFINTGDTTPALNDGTEFGSVPESGGTRTQTFTIRNSGTAELRLNGTPRVSLSGANASDFAVTRLPAGTIPAGGQTTFEITFDPSATGLRKATVSIPDERDGGAPYTFGIQGTGVPLDFGDAPTGPQSGFAASYPTTLADDGARHGLGGPKLGANRDADADGQPTARADGDNANGSPNDEDGVRFLAPLFTAVSDSTSSAVEVNLQNADPRGNRLDAWIDFNRDGDWLDPGEQIVSNVDLGTTNGIRRVSFTIPAGSASGATFARFRLSTAGGLAPTGLANDGEVEDYAVALTSATGRLNFAIPAKEAVTEVRENGTHVEVRQAGTVLMSVPVSEIQSLAIQGTTENDTISLTSRFSIPLSVDGQRGSDRLQLQIDADTTLTNSKLLVAGSSSISFTRVSGIAVTGGDGDNTLDASAYTLGGVTLSGGGGNDVLFGGSSGDLLIGGAGDDRIDGGGGVDTSAASGDIDVTVTESELIGEGADSMTGIAVVRFDGGAGNNTFRTSGWLGRVMAFGGGGDDSLTGGIGDDTLGGGTGNDSLDGGDGVDRLTESGANNLTLVSDASFTAGSLTGLGTDVLRGIETAELIGTAGADGLNAAGFAGKVSLIGGDGRDTLIGGPNDDWISGNGDFDQLHGNGGNDTLIGGGGVDLLDGGDGNDRLRGQGMSDTLVGGLGDDDLDGGVGEDRIRETADVNFSVHGTASSGRLIGLGTDAFRSVEQVSLTGGNSANTLDASDLSGQVILDGAGDDDVLRGSKAASLLWGGAGNDTLIGGPANDTLDGQDGDDSLTGGAGSNYILGRAGRDIVTESGNANFRVTSSSISWTGSNYIGKQDIEGIQLIGGAGNNLLDASQSTVPTTLSGGGGNDTIKGSSLDDLLIESGDVDFTLTDAQLTGLGTDVLSNIDRYRLSGGPNANRLDASATARPVTLIGGAGDDTLLIGSSTVVRDGGPSLQVRGGDEALIANGAVAPNAANGTDLGFAVVATERNTATFRLTNLGGTELRFTGPVTISGPAALDFEVIRLAAPVVGVEESTSFTLAFRPSATGLRTATIQIPSDDPTVPTYSFEVQGTGTSDGMSLRPQRLGNGLGWSDAQRFTEVNGTVFFTATDGARGTELWRTDGTDGSTRLVADINPNGSSSPTWLTNVNGTLFFVANDGVHGPELWKSDGTAEGTVMVAEIVPAARGSDIYYLTAVGDTLFFYSGGGLWKSDGTEAGTSVVKTASVYNLTNVGGILLFGVFAPNSQVELWRSDGTTEGTYRLQQQVYFSNGVAVLDETVYLANNYLHRFNESLNGSERVGDVRDVRRLTNTDEALFFSSTNSMGYGLWTSDGTAAGTTKLAHGNLGEMRAADGTLYFVVREYDSKSRLIQASIWKTDGTSSGTKLIRSFEKREPTSLVTINGEVFFVVKSLEDRQQVWRSDGTANGTRLVREFSGSNSVLLTAVNGRLFFVGNDSPTERSVWTLNTHMPPEVEVRGDSQTIHSGDTSPTRQDGTNFGEVLEAGQTVTRTFTLANLGAQSLELTGSPLVEITGSDAASFTVVRQPSTTTLERNTESFDIEFSATRVGLHTAIVRIGSNDADEPVYEFTIQGEIIGDDFGDAPTDAELAFHGGFPTLLADDGARHRAVGPRLGKLRDSEADGQSAAAADGDDSHGRSDDDGVRFVTALVTSPTRDAEARVSVDVQRTSRQSNRLDAWIDFNQDGDFDDRGEHIIDNRSLGTVDAIHELPFTVPQGAPTGETYARFRLSTAGNLAPNGAASDGEVEDYRITIYPDGQAPTPQRVPSGSVTLRPTSFGDSVSTIAYSSSVTLGTNRVFSQYDSAKGHELWREDTTTGVKTLVKDINPNANPWWGSKPAYLSKVGEVAIFAADDGSSGRELWRTDGTTAGTILLKDIAPGSAHSDPTDFLFVNGRLVFTATNAASGRELWTTDGTAAGTVLIRDFVAGSESASPWYRGLVNDRLYFTTYLGDGRVGQKLWVTDGTAANTVQLAEFSQHVRNAFRQGDSLLLTVFVNSNTTEVWKTDGTASGTIRLGRIESSQANSFPAQFVTIGQSHYFVMTTSFYQGVELWRSDGGVDDARKILDFPKSGVGSAPEGLTAIDGRLYYTAWDRAGVRALFLFNPTPPPLAAPAEIDVRGEGQSIADGDDTPANTDYTDFGGVVMAQSATRAFEIVNVGERRLHLTGSPRVEISGPNAAEFRVIARPVAGLSPNERSSFEIQFSPADIGLRTAIVRIANSDSDESVFDFMIQGTGVPLLAQETDDLQTTA